MKQIVKTLSAMLLIAMCLTSDTAQYASQFQGSRLSFALPPPHLGKAHTSMALRSIRHRFKVQESAERLSMNYAAYVSTGQKLPSWESQRLTHLQLTPLCGFPQP